MKKIKNWLTKKRILFISIITLLLIILYYTFSALYHHFNHQLILYGNVDIRDVNLGFRVSGRLQTLKVDEGDRVQPGELIAQLDPEPYIREVLASEAAVKQQKALLAYAETVYAREKKLFGTGASSTDKYNNALSSRNAAKANLEKAIADLSQSMLRYQDTNLYVPSEGIVLTRAVEPGTMLAISDTVITVTLIDPIWVRAYISESELGRAKPGTKVRVYADSFPNKFFEGQIGFVSPTAEFTPKTVETPDLRTELVYRLRIVMQDPHHELRQGMPVTVKVLRG
ncbi:MAG: efflux RND transporter periplasmic adaptor subunit [Gammaproteobacteria bacterium]